MATAVVHYSAAAVSDRGRKRPSNEDAFGYSIEHGVYLVCDGMGGAAAGEIASSLAVDEVMRVLGGREADGPMDAANRTDIEAGIDAAIEAAILAANDAIFSRSQSNANLSGMGTTLVAIVVEESHVRVVNIGDSRCYRLRAATWSRLRRTIRWWMSRFAPGRMTHGRGSPLAAEERDYQGVGTQSQVSPDIFELEAEPGDLSLLCSDGLIREVPDARIESFLCSGLSEAGVSLTDLCGRLVEAANQAGGGETSRACARGGISAQISFH